MVLTASGSRSMVEAARLMVETDNLGAGVLNEKNITLP